MKTLLSLPAVALVLLMAVLAPRVCSGGTVTLTGGGVAELSYSVHGDQDQIWAQAGTFPDLTDVEINYLASVPIGVLMDYWVPFAAGVPIGRQPGQPCVCLPDFPPDPYSRFDLTATVDLDASSPLKGRPVYVVVMYYAWDQLWFVVHKSSHTFPSGGESANIHVAINPASPRLLAGGLVNRFGYPPETVTPYWTSPYPNWSFAWFGENHPQSGPEDDPDGDAHTNADEMTAGTNPLDAASRLELQWVSRNEDSVTFTWQSVPGRLYAIVQSDTPQIIRPASSPSNAIWANTTQATATVSIPPGATRRFFAIFAW